MRRNFSILFLFVLIFASCSEEQKTGPEKIIPQSSLKAAPENRKGDFARADLVVGQVEISDNGENFTPLKRNDRIYEGQWIKTGEKSRVRILFWQKSSFTLVPESMIRLGHFKQSSQAELLVEKGGVVSQIEKLNPKTGFYRIQGPAMVAGVRGTVFEFSTENGRDTLKVKEGTVAARRNLKNAPDALVSKEQGAQVDMDENQRLLKNRESLKLKVVPVQKLRSGFVFFEKDY